MMSGAVGAFVLLLVPITYVGNSDSYLRLARFLVSGVRDPELTAFRTPGHPLCPIATGVLRYHTFIWAIAAQATMGDLDPIPCLPDTTV